MTITRRGVLSHGLQMGLAAPLVAAPFLAAVPSRALALDGDTAKAHVRAAVDEVLALAAQPGAPESKADPLEAVLRKYAAMPQIARFSAGVAWREMSDDQKGRFVDAFAHFLSVIYARRFSEYSGEQVKVGRAEDAGRRGLRVSSEVTQSSGGPIVVDWMVSDRPGRVVITDIIIEGVSLLVTQREEIGAMLSDRGGDLERLISDLAAS